MNEEEWTKLMGLRERGEKKGAFRIIPCKGILHFP